MSTDANNPAEAEAPAQELAGAVETSDTTADTQATPETEQGTADPGELVDDSMEVDWEGETFRIPAKLKDALLMRADYTRKTQEVAEQRKAFEAERTQFTQDSEMREKYFQQSYKVHQITQALKDYENVDWGALQDQDPQAFDYHDRRQRLLEKELITARGEYDATVKQGREAEEREAANLRTRTRAEMVQVFPNWSEAQEADVLRLADEIGLGGDIVPSKPAHWMALMAMKVGLETLKTRQVKAQVDAAAKAPPASEVKTRAPAGKDPDRMTDREWMRAFEQKRYGKRAS